MQNNEFRKLNVASLSDETKAILNRNAENSVRTIGSKEIGDTPEEQDAKAAELREQRITEAKQKAKEIAENMVKKQFRTMFLQVYDEVEKNGKTVEDLIEEVAQKKCRMTKSARDFVVNFEADRIRQWIADENEMRAKALEAKMKKFGKA